MTYIKKIKDLSKPYRYLALEKSKHKSNTNGIKIALLYVGSFESSYSSYAYQSLYSLFDANSPFKAYRFILPQLDFIKKSIQDNEFSFKSHDDLETDIADCNLVFCLSESSDYLSHFKLFIRSFKPNYCLFIQPYQAISADLMAQIEVVFIGEDTYKIKDVLKEASSVADILKKTSDLAVNKRIYLNDLKSSGLLSKSIKPYCNILDAARVFNYLELADELNFSELYNVPASSTDSNRQNNIKRLHSQINLVPEENEIYLFPLGISSKMRTILNVQKTYFDLVPTIKKSLATGWRIFNLSFIIGHPLEDELEWRNFKKDIQQIHDLVSTFKKIECILFIKPFSPHSHSPYLWDELISYQSYEEKINSIKVLIETKTNFKLVYQEYKHFLEKLISLRADSISDINAYTELVYQESVEFYSNSSAFTNNLVKGQSFGASFPNLSLSKTELDEIKNKRTSISKLISEKMILEDGELDLKQIKKSLLNLNIQLSKGTDLASGAFGSEELTYGRSIKTRANQGEDVYKRYRLMFRKLGPAAFFASNDLKAYFVDLFAEANIPIRFTKGFVPTAKLTLSTMISGLESLEEYIDVEINSIKNYDFITALQGLGDKNLQIVNFKEIASKAPALSLILNLTRYRLSSTNLISDLKFDQYLKQEKISQTRLNKNLLIELDLKKFIYHVEYEPQAIILDLQTVENRTLKIQELLDSWMEFNAFNTNILDVSRLGHYNLTDGKITHPMDI